MLKIAQFSFNPFGENTYIIFDSATKEAVVIDPGMANQHEEEIINRYIIENRLSIKATLLTHIHIDHTFGIDYIKQHYNAPLMAHRDDEFLGQRRMEQAKMFHLPMTLSPVVIDKYIDEGEILSLGETSITAIHAPGHSPGSVLFYIPSSAILFSGDVIFKGSIGRTDLPGGDYAQLIASINRKIVELPMNTTIYPGHGDSTTIAEEIRFNPYF